MKLLPMLVCSSWLFVGACSASSKATKQTEATKRPAKSAAQIARQQEDATRAVKRLQEGDFKSAAKEAKEALAKDPSNPQASAVSAISHYIEFAPQFPADLEDALNTNSDTLNYRTVIERNLKALESITQELEVAALSPEISLELCPACWEYDWNRSGAVEERDKKLLQIEFDADGKELPDEDARRKPTFRFDHGDVYWAIAMTRFQQAVLHFAVSYRWADLIQARSNTSEIVLHLESAEHLKKTRDLILRGLVASEQERRAYLAETDDDREFLPNPTQKSHPIPLVVDEALYQTWAQIVEDVTLLTSGKESLDLNEVALLGDRQLALGLRGPVDLSALFETPRDLVLSTRGFGFGLGPNEDLDLFMKTLFQDAYPSMKKASLITKHLTRITNEVHQGDDTFERKLKYLLWAN